MLELTEAAKKDARATRLTVPQCGPRSLQRQSRGMNAGTRRAYCFKDPASTVALLTGLSGPTCGLTGRTFDPVSLLRGNSILSGTALAIDNVEAPRIDETDVVSRFSADRTGSHRDRAF